MGIDVLAKNVAPFWGRVAVIDSPVDEEERASGLVLPLSHDGDDEVKRGVVVDVDDDWNDPDRRRACEKLAPGTVVYYRGGIRIRDVVLLDVSAILAYEP